MTEQIIERAELLLQQNRYTEARKLLKDVLSSEPNNIYVLAMLAETNIQLDENHEAHALINAAIGIDPSVGHLFYIRARVLMRMDKYDEAESDIAQAIRINPEDDHSFALWALIKNARKQFEEALEKADRALAIDPSNLLALNARSTALLKLNRKDESARTIEGALKEDPNNAYTHANQGWILLERGQSKEALEHFREALRNDPNNEIAQAGMVQALKANNAFYRLFLKYTFWIGNLTSKYQWGVIIGFYLGVKGLNAIAENNATLQPYLTPIIILLGLVAFSTWIISPLSNLLFRINKYGKHLLSKKEIRSSNYVGISLVISLLGILLYFITSDVRFLPVAVFGFAMMLPLGTMLNPTKVKYSLVIYTIVLALLGMASIAVIFSYGEIFNLFTAIFFFGFIGFQWVANFMLIRENNI